MRTSGAGVGEGRNFWRQGQITNASTKDLTERVLRRGSGLIQRVIMRHFSLGSWLESRPACLASITKTMSVSKYYRRYVHRCVSPQSQSFLLWEDLHHYSVQRTSDVGQKSALDGDKDSILHNVLSKAIRKLTKYSFVLVENYLNSARADVAGLSQWHAVAIVQVDKNYYNMISFPAPIFPEKNLLPSGYNIARLLYLISIII